VLKLVAVEKQEVLHILSVSAACNAHAPYYTVTFGLPGSATFFHITSKTARFRKRIIEHKACVLIFSTTIVRYISF